MYKKSVFSLFSFILIFPLGIQAFRDIYTYGVVLTKAAATYL